MKKWWDTVYLTVMDQYGLNVAVHAVNSPDEAARFFNEGDAAVYTDFLSREGD